MGKVLGSWSQPLMLMYWGSGEVGERGDEKGGHIVESKMGSTCESSLGLTSLRKARP